VKRSWSARVNVDFWVFAHYRKKNRSSSSQHLALHRPLGSFSWPGLSTTLGDLCVKTSWSSTSTSTTTQPDACARLPVGSDDSKRSTGNGPDHTASLHGRHFATALPAVYFVRVASACDSSRVPFTRVGLIAKCPFRSARISEHGVPYAESLPAETLPGVAHLK
jgi:hypothetical protein